MKTAFLTVFLAALPLVAQEHSVVASLAKHLKLSKEYTIAIAQQMPADSYGFKPNAEEMSFGEQMSHIANANAMFGGILNNTKGKDYNKTDKDSVIAALNDSFDGAIAVVSGLKESELFQIKKTPEGDWTILDSALLMLDHTTHHRAQCVVYLRVKGIKPAEYRF